jgi:hypothetical protein
MNKHVLILSASVVLGVGHSIARAQQAGEPEGTPIHQMFGGGNPALRDAHIAQNVELWTYPTPALAVARVAQVLPGLLGDDPGAWGFAHAQVVACGTEEMSLHAAPPEAVPGQLVWLVTLNDAKVAVKSWSATKASTKRDVRVWLGHRGRVLRVEIEDPRNKRVATPEPSAAMFDLERSQSGPERWKATRTEEPTINLAQAIDAIEAKSMGGSATAKKIIAHFVGWEYGAKPRYREVRSIDLRGMEPFPASQPGVREEDINHLRHIVDARTGEWLMASSVPQPVREPKAPDSRKPAEPSPAPPASLDPDVLSLPPAPPWRPPGKQ